MSKDRTGRERTPRADADRRNQFPCVQLTVLLQQVAPSPASPPLAKRSGNISYSALHVGALDLVGTDVIAAPLVQLRGPRRCVIRHRSRILERATVFQMSGDAGRAECVVPIAVAMPAASARRRTIAYAFACGSVRMLSCPAPARDRTEKRPLAVVSDADVVELLVQIRFKRVMARHLGQFAATQSHPDAPVLHADVAHPHRERRAHLCERKHHQCNQRYAYRSCNFWQSSPAEPRPARI